jgi:hypothetical protein
VDSTEDGLAECGFRTGGTGNCRGGKKTNSPLSITIMAQVEYTLRPYRLCQLHLRQLHYDPPHTATDTHYTLLYMDLQNQPDFIILAQHFDDAARMEYTRGKKEI